jgi:NAD(P)H-dependent FMN reductase
MKRFLAISGSLRHVSTNTALLRAMAAHAPDGMSVELYDGIGDLPIFNPDREGDLTPPSVSDLGGRVREADGLIISCPEYAHGIPGGLKNLLDWLVSRDEIPNKPAMLLRASSRNEISHASLQEVLRTMSVALMPEAGIGIHLINRSPAQIETIFSVPERRAELRDALLGFAAWIDGAR